MAGEYQCFYRTLLYRPDPFKPPLNFGLVMVAQRESDKPVLLSRVTKSWSRLRAIDPALDPELLTQIADELPQLLAERENPREFLKKLDSYWSCNVELGGEHALLSLDPAKAIGELGSQYLKYGWSADSETIREHLKRQMETAFRENGIWKLMKHEISLSEVTERADPLVIDFGYAYKDHFKFFHALALSSQPDSGLALASRMSDIISSVAEKHGLMTWFTAVVENDLERGDPEIDFALMKMEKSEIHLAVAAEIPALAQQARLELLGK